MKWIARAECLVILTLGLPNMSSKMGSGTS
jgi:hypothetical protein